ncbi:PH domain-containing protein [Halogeometricum borinquense]|uniref:PH domain-containing protein n=1 Tax=Halogeometricum borinquense TaxID=60847 RepID=A0A482T9U3_9EURY|nr:PH domain-containing protein [Halogeometricum borinquense]RYJ13637.1 PH domain-containing protein [Halogeometricum borinquense]
MSNPDWITLDDGETVEWTGSPRLVSVFAQLLVAVLVVVGSVALPVVTRLPLIAIGPGVLLALLITIASVYPIYTTAFLVTDRAVYTKRGRRSRRVTTLELDRVQDVSYGQSAVGGVLGYGTVTVEIAGGGNVSLSAVGDPKAVADLVGRLTRGTDDTIPGSVEQWRAVRDELRGIRSALESSR